MGNPDSTIVILAFPTISESLHSDMVTTLWIILIYLLVVAVCMTQLGRSGDLYYRSRMINVGFGGFTIGSLFCGLSWSTLVSIPRDILLRGFDLTFLSGRVFSVTPAGMVIIARQARHSDHTDDLWRFGLTVSQHSNPNTQVPYII